MTASSSGASRAPERYRLARLAVVLGGVDSVVNALASVARIALLLAGLGRRQYGIYVAILGLVATANLLDFGLHYGVINAVSRARGKDDLGSLRRTMATAFVTYLLISAAACLLFIPAVALAPLGWILSIEPGEVALARWVAVLGIGRLLVIMPLKVFPAGLQGFQEQYVFSVFRSVTSIAQLAALAVALLVFDGGLLAVVGVLFASDILLWAAFALWTSRNRPLLALDLRAASRAAAPALIASGLTFLVINLANMLKITFGSAIVSHSLGPDAVPAFAVPFALFNMGFMLCWMMASSFWPAYGEAAARGDWDWIRQAFRLGTKAALGTAALLSVLGALFGDLVIRVWTPKAGLPSLALLLSLALWLVAQSIVGAGVSLLNGLGHSRIVMKACLLEGALAFVASVLLVGPFGREGVGSAMAAAGLGAGVFLLFAAVPTSTDGRVPAPFSVIGRVAVCAAAAFGVGSILRRWVGGDGWLGLVSLAGPTALAYLAAAWWLVLSPGERQRVLSWIFARLGRRPSPG